MSNGDMYYIILLLLCESIYPAIKSKIKTPEEKTRQLPLLVSGVLCVCRGAGCSLKWPELSSGDQNGPPELS